MHEYEYLAHYGTPDMKWGQRLYQNKDGSLTPLGRIHYGVGEARKKAGEKVKSATKAAGTAIKNSPKTVPAAVKKTMSDLRADRRASRAASKARRAQVKKERFEAAEERRREKAEKLARKLAEREQKTLIKDLKNALHDTKIEAAKKKVDDLMAKRDRIKEEADLKAEAKQLKKEMKKFKRDAEKDAAKKYDKKRIRDMTDEEIDQRIARLKKEATLIEAEATRGISPGAKKVLDALGNVALDTIKTTAKTTGERFADSLLESAGIKPTKAKNGPWDNWSDSKSKARSEQERRVRSYYSEGLTYKEMANLLDVSESEIRDLLITSGATARKRKGEAASNKQQGANK